MRRLGLFVAAVAVVSTALFAGTSSVQAPSAKAWAWKDVCTMFLFNKTGQRTNVRPILYTPVTPNPSSLAQYAIFVASGVPTTGAGALTSTGIPVTWGCHVFINFANPGPTVSCEVSAPTKGANTFHCDGNATTRILEDSDDIAGNIFIPSGSGPGDEPLAPRQPREGPPVLKRSQLPGSGWKDADDGLADLGLLGQLTEAGEPSDACTDAGAGPTPKKVSTGLLSRRDGDQWVGAVSTRFARKTQARATLSEALSTPSMKCLRKLLTNGDVQAKAKLQPLASGGLGRDVRSSRVRVRQTLVGGTVRSHYLDILGTTRGSTMAFVMIGSSGQPADAQQKQAAMSAAMESIGR